MKKIIYCECGWAGSPEQLEVSETVNNITEKVCPRCGTDMLPPPVDVGDQTFNMIMDKQKQDLMDRDELDDNEI